MIVFWNWTVKTIALQAFKKVYTLCFGRVCSWIIHWCLVSMEEGSKNEPISWKLWFSLESSFLDTWENVSKGYNQCIFSFLGSLLHLPFLMRQETLMKTISGKAGFRPFYWYQNNCVAWGKWTKNHWGLLNIWKRILNVLYPNYYSLTPPYKSLPPK